jgi:M6 family metalloprotease-like protein
LNSYFKEVSYGKDWIEGDVYGWYRLNKTLERYGKDGIAIDDPNFDGEIDSWQLISDAVGIADKDIDFSKYEYVMIVHAGEGQETSKNKNDIWSVAYVRGIFIPTKDGITIQKAAIVPEKEAMGISPLGVYAHEFAHLLGLPDLYDIYKKAPCIGPWSLMDSGVWNGKPRGSSPPHPEAWSKIELGWIPRSKVLFVNSSSYMNVTLYPIEKEFEGYLAIKIPLKGSMYYLIEARKNIGFDEALPESGVLITIVDERKTSGRGIVRAIDANSTSKTLNDALFKVGQKFMDVENEVVISVISEKNNSFLLSIDRRSPLPDLSVRIEVIPEIPRVNQNVTFKIYVLNVGTKEAKDIDVSLFLDDSLVGLRKIPSLKPEETTTIFMFWNSSFGNHSFKVLIDPSNKIKEFNKENNQKTLSLTIGYILTIKSTIAFNVTFKIYVLNVGTKEAKDIDVSLFLDDSLVGLRKIPSLKPEETTTIFMFWNSSFGNHSFKVLIDPSNKIKEFNKENNQKTLSLTIGYILTIKSTIAFNGTFKIDEFVYSFDKQGKAQISLLPGLHRIEVPDKIVENNNTKRIVFVGWSDGVNSSARQIEISNKDLELTLEYKLQYYLRVDANGGIVLGEGWYDFGSIANVSANSPIILEENKTRKVFSYWSGDIESNSTKISIVINGNKSIKANWETQHYLRIESEAGKPLGEGWYKEGSIANFSISPEVKLNEDIKMVFIRWIGDYNSTKPNGSILIDKPKTIQAVWKKQYRVIFSPEGIPSNSSISLIINGSVHDYFVPFIHEEWIDENSLLTFEVNPKEINYKGTDYTFKGLQNIVGEFINSPLRIIKPEKLKIVFVQEGKAPLIETKQNVIDRLQINPSISMKYAATQIMVTMDYALFVIKFYLNEFYTLSPLAKDLIESFSAPAVMAIKLGLGLFNVFGPELGLLISSISIGLILGLVYIMPILLTIVVLLDRIKGIAAIRPNHIFIIIILWTLSISLIFIGGILSFSYLSAIATLGLLCLTMLLISTSSVMCLQYIIKKVWRFDR